MKFQMLFEIESCLEQSQQTETLTCNFHPESENVVGLEWDLGSQLINLLKVLPFSFFRGQNYYVSFSFFGVISWFGLFSDL